MSIVREIQSEAPDGALQSVKDWLSEWEDAIQSNDLDKGRTLFADEASGFGTVTYRTEGLDDLVENQWAQIWPRTRGFSFETEHTHIHISGDGLQACAHAPWSSLGKTETGEDRDRHGRATVVLVRSSMSGPWRCVHTHFSMWPDTADTPLLRKD